MHKCIIVNEYNGYNSVNDEPLTKVFIESEHPELNEIFEDLFRYPGNYVIYYEFDCKKIYIKNGYHTPLGQWPIRIDKQWGDYVISQMTKWDYKKRIVNEIL